MLKELKNVFSQNILLHQAATALINKELPSRDMKTKDLHQQISGLYKIATIA